MHAILSLLKYFKEYLGEIKVQSLILKCNLWVLPHLNNEIMRLKGKAIDLSKVTKVDSRKYSVIFYFDYLWSKV